MKNVIVEEQCPNVAKILTGPIVKYITLATNNCGYSGKTEELRASYIHHFFHLSLPLAKKKIIIGVKPLMDPLSTNIGKQ